MGKSGDVLQSVEGVFWQGVAPIHQRADVLATALSGELINGSVRNFASATYVT